MSELLMTRTAYWDNVFADWSLNWPWYVCILLFLCVLYSWGTWLDGRQFVQTVSAPELIDAEDSEWPRPRGDRE